MRNKFNAKKTVVDNIKFDSMAEARRYKNLKLLERSGSISDLELQPRYDLIINDIKVGFYKADFRYVQDGQLIIEDVKGMKTPIYNLKKKMIKAIYGFDILETN
tara:strand:+ start:46721 stop:47032 length:312 start_codon:yes stop_codon:yes gene_type:complete